MVNKVLKVNKVEYTSALKWVNKDNKGKQRVFTVLANSNPCGEYVYIKSKQSKQILSIEYIFNV